jgi:hypothetical protein
MLKYIVRRTQEECAQLLALTTTGRFMTPDAGIKLKRLYPSSQLC